MQQKPKICHKKTTTAHALLAPHPRQGTRALPYKMCVGATLAAAPGRTEPSAPTTLFVGADAYIGPPPNARKTARLPCLKGGGPTEGWWRDSCGVGSYAFAVSSCGGKNPPVTTSPCQPPLGKGANSVGRGGPHPRPGICRTSCKNPVIAKPVTDVTGCGNPYCRKKHSGTGLTPPAAPNYLL